MILLVPEKGDPERDAVAAAWGGEVIRIGRFWDPPAVDRAQVRVYGNDTFCLVLAQKLSLALVSPPDDLLIQLGAPASRRTIAIARLADATFPAFLKPLVPKLFRAAVYETAAQLADETRGLEAGTPILVSEIVRFENEVRCWILDGDVVSLAAYEGTAELAAARAFASSVAKHGAVPRTCVLDIGEIAGRGWAVIEANASWGAGLNGCDPAAAARCIAAACTAA